MNEVLFVNEYTRTKNTLKEAYKYWYFRRPLGIIGYAIAVFDALLYLFLWANEFYVDPTMVILLLVLAAMLPVIYVVQVNAALAKDNQITHGRPVELCLSVTSDKIYIGKAEGDYYLDFSQISYAYDTKGYVVLVTKKTRMLLIFAKDGFTTGDLDGFRAFLAEKSIKIKGQKK